MTTNEPSTLSIQQLAEWAKRLPGVLEVRPHHLECRALLAGGDQSRCNCDELIFPDDEYYRPVSITYRPASEL
jgi:hypothetical protein